MPLDYKILGPTNRMPEEPKGERPDRMEFGLVFDPAETSAAPANGGQLCVGLIDSYRFSQECLIKAFEVLDPRLVILAAETVQDLLNPKGATLDVIIYYSHATEASEAAMMHNIKVIRQAFDAVPLVVLSDADDAQQTDTVRGAMKSGAHGFIPTKTTGIPIALAAMRFARAGGTFAPLEILLANGPDSAPPPSEPVRQKRLTSRQMAVLSHLQQGKANKIIAYELSMSESTVKVHVRNIMRKMGATNRTQAAYKAQMLLRELG